ncbi:MAG: GMC family oxidoreductase N-terminal domain-containing protein [Deltaproteobacteria bacterium]|nr:GMC family oxidoreductase N-terminal domain-containing protein [Deltaproteobacteria bacterium]MBI3018150.1 GMC family oxidoreductase N-terminal domain-containing protein [Deltaproteobacteria bacterium]
MKKFDICIIGSGAGGALAAYGLQKKFDSIAIFEKGDWVKRSQTPLYALSHIYRDQGFVSGMGNALIGIPTGEAIGGTTVINSGTCFETPKAVIQEWKESLDINISYEELSPYFSKLRELLSIQKVSEDRISSGNKLFREGLQKLGFQNSFPLDRAEKECVGSGRCPFVCPEAAKQSTDVSILPKFLAQGGEVISNTSITHILEEKDKVLLYGKTKEGKKIKSECRTLVIAGGTLSSPILIRKNRLGSHWRKTGNELSIHPALKVLAQLSYPLESWNGVPQALGFKHPNFPALSFEGVFTPPQLASIVLPLDGKNLDDWLQNYNRVASFGVLAKDTSRGKVRSYPGFGLWVWYFLNQKDFLALREGARFMGLTYLAAGAQKVVLPFNGIQNEFSNFDELKNFNFSPLKPSQLYAMGFHPLGTCGMGRVVDDHLKLYGSQRIFVADGSVVPSSLGVNPQITIMALALRLAEQL